MKGINGQPYVDCQNFIDLETLESLNQEICTGIALSRPHAGVYGPGVVESDKYGNFLTLKTKMNFDPLALKVRWKEMDHDQQNTFLKLYTGLYNPSTTVYLREAKKDIPGIEAYKKKMNPDFFEWTDHIKYFPELEEWLKNLIGPVFKSYGRILFFIHEHDCELLLHRDGIMYYPHKNEFLWLNPMKKKSFYVLDENTNTRHYVDSPVVFFNDLDQHGGDKSNVMTWSLRIDGEFSETFKANLGIQEIEKY
jgi:hypothetical protein